MQIPVNKNIDEYKDDFFKGLTLQQTALCVAAGIAGTAAFLAGSMVFHLPQTISLHLALPFALPFAAAGFLKVHNMAPDRYFRLKKKVKEQPAYYFRPQIVADLELPKEETDIPDRRIKKKIYLDDMETDGTGQVKEQGAGYGYTA